MGKTQGFVYTPVSPGKTRTFSFVIFCELSYIRILAFDFKFVSKDHILLWGAFYYLIIIVLISKMIFIPNPDYLILIIILYHYLMSINALYKKNHSKLMFAMKFDFMMQNIHFQAKLYIKNSIFVISLNRFYHKFDFVISHILDDVVI